MRTSTTAAYKALQAINTPVIDRQEDNALFMISGEDNDDGRPFIDYYEYNYGEFGVDQTVCDILKKHGLICEWINPGLLGVYPE